MLKSVFNSFKSYVLKQKFKKIALNSYMLKLMKKALAGFHLVTMKLRLEDAAAR